MANINNKEGKKSVEKEYISPQELAEYLGVSVNTVYSWIWQKKVPHVKLSRLVKFSKTGIDDWMKSMNVMPADTN